MKQRIAIFIDIENVGINCLSHIQNQMAKSGQIACCTVYGNWRSEQLKNHYDTVTALGMIPKDTHPVLSGKNTADMVLCIDVMQMVCETNIQSICIVSSDSDFIPLVRVLRQRNVTVYGIGDRNKISDKVSQSYNEFFYLQDLTQQNTQSEAQIAPSIATDLVQTVSSVAQKEETPPPEPVPAFDLQSISWQEQQKLLNLLRRSLSLCQQKGKSEWVYLGDLSAEMKHQMPSFSIANYERMTLKKLTEQFGIFDICFGSIGNCKAYIKEIDYTPYLKRLPSLVLECTPVRHFEQVAQQLSELSAFKNKTIPQLKLILSCLEHPDFEISINEQTIRRKTLLKRDLTLNNVPKTDENKVTIPQDWLKKWQLLGIIIQAVRASKKDKSGRKANIGAVGSLIKQQLPTFSVKQYGYKTLSALLESFGNFETSKMNSTVYVEEIDYSPYVSRLGGLIPKSEPEQSIAYLAEKLSKMKKFKSKSQAELQLILACIDDKTFKSEPEKFVVKRR